MVDKTVTLSRRGFYNHKFNISFSEVILIQNSKVNPNNKRTLKQQKKLHVTTGIHMQARTQKTNTIPQ